MQGKKLFQKLIEVRLKSDVRTPCWFTLYQPKPPKGLKEKFKK